MVSPKKSRCATADASPTFRVDSAAPLGVPTVLPYIPPGLRFCSLRNTRLRSSPRRPCENKLVRGARGEPDRWLAVAAAVSGLVR